MKLTTAVCSLLLAYLLVQAVRAQSTDATLSGVVVDPAGKAIPNAEIEVENESTAIHYTTKTNDAGIYTLTILPPGHYRVQVSRLGFKTIIKPGIVLNVQGALALNFTLPVGATSESITVESGALSINTSDGSVSTVIDRDFVENIPLNGRSFQDLLTLSPGVYQVANSSSYGTGYSGDIVVNGQRTEANYYTVDGVSANTGVMPNPFGGGAGVSGSVPGLTALGSTQSLTSVDSLQEFRSTTSTYSAEYGRTPGGQFAFSTRSGTDEFHGTLFDFFRNDKLDANNWFNDYFGYPKGKERQNDFGGTLGGPIDVPGVYRGQNRSFFFVSYEGLRLTSPQTATPVEVPSQNLRQSSPAALRPLLNAFPVANGGSQDLTNGFAYYIESVSYPSSLDNTSIRIDQKIGDKLSLFGRYANSPSNTTSYNLAIRHTSSLPTRTLTFGSTYALSPLQSNELRFNLTQSDSRLSDQSTSLGGAVPLDLNEVPGPGSGSFPRKNSQLFVNFTFAAFTSFKLSPLPAKQHQLNLIDTHNWLLGKHGLKAGVDWRRIQTTLPAWDPLEEISFSSQSQVLSNTPSYGAVQTWGTLHDTPVYLNFSSFLEDEWKVSPHLSLSLGIRWDLNPAPTNAGGPSPYTVDQITNLRTAKLAPQGTPLWKTDWLGFAPRFGAAYQVWPSSRRSTVLRTGFGVFYDPGNTIGSLGFEGIGFVSSAQVPAPSYPLTSAQLNVPPPSAAVPYGGGNSSTSVIGFDPNLKLPYSLQYTLAVEQELTRCDTVTLGYVGSVARRLLTTFYAYPGKIGNANFGKNTALDLIQGRASSGFNSLQAKYQRSLSRGLQALMSYTFAHSIDDASSNFNIYYLLWASSDFDVRHSFQAALTYDTPAMKSLGRAASIFKDWGIDLRYQARTALPVDVIGVQQLNPSTGEYIQYQPNLVAGQPLYVYGRAVPGGRAINYHAFQEAASGVQGNLPRNYARAFGSNQLDATIRRNIYLDDQLHLQFRAEAFNIPNHPMFGPVYNYLSYGPSLFGRARNTMNSEGNLNSLYQMGGPRSLQLSLKLIF